MLIDRHFAHRCAAAAAAGLFALAPSAPAAARPRAAAEVVGGERLARPGVQVAPRSDAPALPGNLTGRSWLVADGTSGEVLASYNAHAELPPASTLKMLFADTVLPKLDREAVHRVAPEELAGLGAGSSLVGIKEDLDYKVEDLWRGVFLSSGNDAVHVLAHMNGGIDRTVAQMQARADALQARDTHVVTPDGYDQDGQVSSAYDLTLFARAGLRNPDFRAYCSTRDAQFPGAVDRATGQRGSFGIANTDRLLGTYPGLIGVKNGYTTNAGSTFTGAAERDGRLLLVTVMHTTTYQKVYDEAAALLDWGFAAADRVNPVGELAEDTSAVGAAAPTAEPRPNPVPDTVPSAAPSPPRSVPAAPPVAAPADARQPEHARHSGGTAGMLAAGLCTAAAAAAALRLRRDRAGRLSLRPALRRWAGTGAVRRR
ncbi:D-alanyl-D-alanine carboxypeptidase [Kitasatospora sp. NPDC093679]|uniref:D-alanyl-D-alanine carboxypeptidase family protein n=1 Tax=Kitasatospora sp. NPDC093679 TaxID=3154983 RepID=UPI003423A418